MTGTLTIIAERDYYKAELAKRDAEIAELKQMLMRWLNDALSAEDVKKLEKQTLEVLK